MCQCICAVMNTESMYIMSTLVRCYQEKVFIRLSGYQQKSRVNDESLHPPISLLTAANPSGLTITGVKRPIDQASDIPLSVLPE